MGKRFFIYIKRKIRWQRNYIQANDEYIETILPIAFSSMTTSIRQVQSMSNSLREAIVDKLRSCSTPEEILSFEDWFNTEANAGPLYAVICDFLRNRSISRSIAAKWLGTLLDDRENKLKL